MIESLTHAKLPAFEIIQVAMPRYFLGLSLETDEKQQFKDGQKLAKDFADARDGIRRLAYPYVSVTITGKKGPEGKFTYFTGEEVEPKAKAPGLAAMVLPAGTYGCITVKRNPTWLLGMRLAQARKHFYQVYLPASGYELGDAFEEAELWEQAEESKPRPSQSVRLLVSVVRLCSEERGFR